MYRNNKKYVKSDTTLSPEVVNAVVNTFGIKPYPVRGHDRFYLKSWMVEEIGAISIDRYKSGNVCSFMIWDVEEGKFEGWANGRAYGDGAKTFIEDGVVYTSYDKAPIVDAIADRLQAYVADDLAKEEESEPSDVAEDTPTEPAEDKNNAIIADVLADVPVTKKAAVDAGLEIVAAAGWQSKPTRKAMQASLEERGFAGTIGSLRAALEDLITNTVSVNVALPDAEAETADEAPVETESDPVDAPTVPALGVAAAEIPTPVAVVKVDEEQADADADTDTDTDTEKSAESKSDADADTSVKPTPVADTDPTPTESAEEIADRLLWKAEVPKSRAMKLLALAYSGEEELSTGELLDWLNADETPLSDFSDRIDDAFNGSVPLWALRELLVEIAALGQEDREKA